jgi:rfaE bifunctional protein nucleotidyltransferase chain/domain
MDNTKIITKEVFGSLREKLRQERKKVVLCHGVYDLLHYGHIEHLKEAKAQGDILVVSVTAAKYVNKGPGRPYFNDKQRMAFLASLEFVDYVVLSEAVTVHKIVEFVQPDVYVKGQEYEQEANDITGNISGEQKIVKKYGGSIYFTQGEVFSSTKLLNNFFAALPENVVKESYGLKEKYGIDLIEKIRLYVNGFSKLKVLVVGDIIIDEYIFCKLQGLTTKDAAMSTKYDFEERYAGGALAVARHLASFSNKVTVCSMMGLEPHLKEYVGKAMQELRLDVIYNDKFITPVKRRFLKQHLQRQEYEKLFSINMLLDSKQMKNVDYTLFRQELEEILPEYDLVVVCDYGHGLLDDKSLRIIEEKARFLAVNCQANSSNFGTNIITKYKRADTFVVDERELRLALGQPVTDAGKLLAELAKQLHSKCAWVTLGADGALGWNEKEEIGLSALTLHVKDTVGAGDAFYSLVALAAKEELPLDIATLFGNAAGAIKTNVVGNARPIEKVELLKYLNTILNV